MNLSTKQIHGKWVILMKPSSDTSRKTTNHQQNNNNNNRIESSRYNIIILSLHRQCVCAYNSCDGSICFTTTATTTAKSFLFASFLFLRRTSISYSFSDAEVSPHTYIHTHTHSGTHIVHMHSTCSLYPSPRYRLYSPFAVLLYIIMHSRNITSMWLYGVVYSI